jgi:hypothetical protein
MNTKGMSANEAASQAETLLGQSESNADPVAGYRAAAQAWELARSFSGDQRCRAITDIALARMEQLEKQLPNSSTNEYRSGTRTIIEVP